MTPHCLPLYVSDRLDFMDLTWKIDVMDYELFRKVKKGTAIHPQCNFSYFKIAAPEGYEKLEIMVNNIRMPIDEIRVFDPKGIMAKKKTKGLRHHT